MSSQIILDTTDTTYTFYKLEIQQEEKKESKETNQREKGKGRMKGKIVVPPSGDLTDT